MLLAAARRRVVVGREPRQAARIARALWIVWALIVWNVVFDHVIVVAGREFIIAAAGQAGAAAGGPFARMDDWMRPAVARGFWIATTACAGLLVTGLTAVACAERRFERPADRTPARTQSTAPSPAIERLAMTDKPRCPCAPSAASSHSRLESRRVAGRPGQAGRDAR